MLLIRGLMFHHGCGHTIHVDVANFFGLTKTSSEGISNWPDFNDYTGWGFIMVFRPTS